MNTEYQRIARNDKKPFINEQCEEVNNRMGNTRDHFKKLGNIKGTFHVRMGMIKDRHIKYLTEAEEVKKRWQEHTEKLYRKRLNDPDNCNGVVTHLEPDFWSVKSSGP